MTRPQHLVIVNETPVEIMATPPPEFAIVGGVTQPNIFEIGKKWRNVHLVLESDAGYDQPIAGDINVYLYHTKGQKAAYFTTLTVAEDMRCDIVLPEHMLGAQYICLSRGEGFPVLVLHKLPDITNPAPDYTLELTVTGDEFDAGGAINVANWNFVDVSGTGLTVSGIVRDSATQVTVTFDPAPMLTVSGSGNGDLDPTFTIDLLGDTFAANASLAINWTIDLGTTGLVLTAPYVVVGPNQVTIATTGNCAEGVVTITALPDALTSGRTSGVCTYTVLVASETSTCVTPFIEGTMTIQAEAAAFTGGMEDSRIFTLVTDDASLSVSSESAPSGVILAQIMHEGHYGW